MGRRNRGGVEKGEKTCSDSERGRSEEGKVKSESIKEIEKEGRGRHRLPDGSEKRDES